jgi:hypothetical protein
MSDLVELTRKLAEIRAHRDASIYWAMREHQNADEYAARITQLEAMLPRAWMDGMEAAEIRACNWVNRDCFDMPEDTGLSLYIRALTIPTSAELLAKLKETT